MIEKKIKHFDLRQIADSGQCFRWELLDEDESGCTYRIPAFDTYIEVAQTYGSDVFRFSCTEDEWEDIWYKYFDLSTDYVAIEEVILGSGDEHLIESYEYGSGVRILQQDLWEMIVTFMISQNNNIKRIRNSVDMLCKRCGKEIGSGVYTFPKPGEVPSDIFLDKTMGFGYRGPYLAEIFEFAKDNPQWINDLKKLSYGDALDALMERKGIGAKVANCICLFGLHHVEAFPIDTHVKQLLEKYYSDGFDFDRYEGFAGIIQQYLFYYELQ
ncbi:MAG: 8-oxoguanine DNA glycosylase [Lachnospiraceae bacterium]|nr:8-oxoguanine DNA glycosylase [Lachnospiraceae bacterium]